MNRNIINAFLGGQSINAYETLGAQVAFENEEGVRFTVWAPNAKSIQVIGSFNGWSCDGCYMEKVDNRGIWSVFVAGAQPWDHYKYRVEQVDGQKIDKMDPFGFYSELRPNTASIIWDRNYKDWNDEKWLASRDKNFNRPLNIYEMHLGAWKKEGEEPVNYKTIAPQIASYMKEHHYTHVEFMPLAEYPFDGSWGYQTSSYFSATSRYGTPDELKYLINHLHENGIGVIFDFVPVHFVMDNFALNKFDGTHMYEYNNENGYSEWGTANFDLWKEEVRSFLMSAAAYWLDQFHVDGLRMDAISNVIFWGGNKERGVNYGAITFIKRLNYKLNEKFPTCMLIAEDSSDYIKVTASTLYDGLGFDYKWDLGWMNDTLKYLSQDAVYRKYDHNKINWSMAYFYNEHFILPFSHDEVVHGKCSIINKMWRPDDSEYSYNIQFSQARALYTYMYTHPGKKLNFMANEIAHVREFDEDEEMDWFLLQYPKHDSFQRYIGELSKLYTTHPALYAHEYDSRYFEWIDADNADENLFSYMRKSEEETLVVIINFSPNTYEKHWFGVPEAGFYKEILNSETDIYSGCNITNPKAVRAKKQFVDYKPYYIEIDVAPYSGIILKHKNAKKKEAKDSKDTKATKGRKKATKK